MVAVGMRIDQRVAVQRAGQAGAMRVVQHRAYAGQQAVGAQLEQGGQSFLQGRHDQREGGIAKRQADGQFKHATSKHGKLLYQ